MPPRHHHPVRVVVDVLTVVVAILTRLAGHLPLVTALWAPALSTNNATQIVDFRTQDQPKKNQFLVFCPATDSQHCQLSNTDYMQLLLCSKTMVLRKCAMRVATNASPYTHLRTQR